MCGIAGIIRSEGLVSLARLQEATRTLVHRGPEGEGYYINKEGSAALGHRRLCIIDPSEGAAQPMHYRNRYHLVYNGELYNYIELREDLAGKGHAFSTSSDTEVVLAAYATWGRDCLQRFDGMFALAIWDEEACELFIARDRFGEKPLFYHYERGQLLFASEMKALWPMGVPREVNHRLLYNFLTIGYTANPFDPAETFYEGVQKLPPASFMVYTPARQQLVIEKYWQVYPEVKESIGEKEAVDQFMHLLTTSVSRRLRSDVPIGTSLSGGLDSSALVAFCDQVAAQHYTHKCFTASFPGFARDELAFASMVASQYGLEHHVVKISKEEVPGLVERVARAQEEPFSSASSLAQYKVYEEARRLGVTVLLDGQGADETLGGYHKYYKWYWQELYRAGRLAGSSELKAAQALGVKESFGVKGKAAALFPHFAASMLQSHKAKTAARHPDLDPEFTAAARNHFYYSTPAHFDLNGALHFNTFTYGLEELLRLADRNSMAHSIEVRLPYLDHQLVEFLFTLPAHFKIHKGWTKWLLRKSAESLLPEAITWRRDKVGFEPPQKAWMQYPATAAAIQEGKRVLVEKGVLHRRVLDKKVRPHDAHAAEASDWKYWTASLLFR
ncbi:MAG TPA: asparagine synthase (glutamine-hydrolyzing) [Chitinophagaceae bacterium]